MATLATLVTPRDVESRLMGKTFTDAETAVIEVWIEDLEADIRARVDDLDSLAGNPIYMNKLKRVITSSIKRVLDNPRGLRQMSISIDDYVRSETVDSTASAGLLYISDEDWESLIPELVGEAFSVRTVATPGFAEYPQ